HVPTGPWPTAWNRLDSPTEVDGAPGRTPFEVSSHTKSAFFQQTLRFWDRLFMSAGFRVEDNSVFGTHWTERGSLAYVIREWDTRLHGGAGPGFRAPTFNDLFFAGFSDPPLPPQTSFPSAVAQGQMARLDRILL